MKTDLKPYDEYKNVSLSWLESVPSHWKIKRAKSMYEKANRAVREEDEVITCFRDGVVTLRKKRRTTGFTESIKEIGYQGIRKGDLIIHVMDAFAGAIGVSDSEGKGTPVYNVCIAKGDFNNYYYAHIIREMAKKGFIQSLYRGIRERSSDFRFDTFANLYLPIPPRNEQDQIVRYLDSCLAKINKFIKTKKKLIEVLREQKQAIINEAVTKGLDSNVKMKPSGIDWLGDIPEGWDTVRCKYLFREIDTRSTTGLETHLSMSQKLGLVPDEQLTERRLLSENYIGGKVCNKDDLVLNRLKAHLGVFALASQTGVISPDYTVLRPNEKIYPIFAETVLKSQKCRRELRIRVRGIVEGFWRLYTDDFNTIVLPLPKYEEQVLIMEYINNKSLSINSTIARIEKEIELIIEYRTRLISDVVTGKVDVRSIVVDDVLENLEEDLDEELQDDESLSDEDGDENAN